MMHDGPMGSVVRCVVFDFDGVLRHYDSIHEAEAARAVDLAPGQLASIAFQRDLLHRMVRGGMTRDDWIEEVGRRVAAPQVVSRWLADWGWVEPAMVELVSDVRRSGTKVALFTNGSDTTPAELDHHRLTGHFDIVFNSWELGLAKPDPDVYRMVGAELGLVANEVMFFDDTLPNVTAAQGVGWKAHWYRTPTETRRILTRHGLVGQGPDDGLVGQGPDDGDHS